MMKIYLSIKCLLTLTTICLAQNNQTTSSDLIDPSLNEIQNIFLNNQAEALLSHTNKVFSSHPPNFPEPEERRSAILLLDGVMHDVYAPYRPPVQSFFKEVIKNAVKEIEQTKIEDGARIWKLYNHGFLVRTKSVTIGFDLISGNSVRVQGFSIEDDDMSAAQGVFP